MNKPSAWWNLQSREFWIVLWKLTQQQRVRLQPSLCPEYTTPYADREFFHAGLEELKDWVAVRWEDSKSKTQLRWITRCIEAPQLEDFLRRYGPTDLAPRDSSPSDIINVEDQARCRAAVAAYGPLGLRTLAHLAFGDSHRLDNWRSLTQEQLVNRLGLERGDCWVQADAADRDTGNIVRVGGYLTGYYPGATLGPRWIPPGYYLWPWDVECLQLTSVGERLLLVENPYPMWELLRRWQGQSITLVCLHGETHFERGESSALGNFLHIVFSANPGLVTWIWCDPDPAGLRIAQNAYQWVEDLGGTPAYRQMDETVLDRLTALVLAEQKLRPLDMQQRQQLLEMRVAPDLEALRHAMLQHGAVGEQEALAVNMDSPT
ncbi:MAG TPA: DUF2399 domain-containing protein [Anaerolineae bacterium]|nr:DUF2399 domain-containing protein [Anaerolineae bacterium]